MKGVRGEGVPGSLPSTVSLTGSVTLISKVEVCLSDIGGTEELKLVMDEGVSSGGATLPG